MEGLIQLVADSFARHGLEPEPASEPQSAAAARPLPETSLPEALLEHNFRKGSTDSAP